VEDPFARLQHEHHREDSGCAYLLDHNEERRCCGTPRRRGSPYCPHHHAMCHIPSGTTEEFRRLREVEALANAVGGRRGRDVGAPPRQFLRRLEHTVRDLSSSIRS
jgi:hypothetical protein